KLARARSASHAGPLRAWPPARAPRTFSPNARRGSAPVRGSRGSLIACEDSACRALDDPVQVVAQGREIVGCRRPAHHNALRAVPTGGPQRQATRRAGRLTGPPVRRRDLISPPRCTGRDPRRRRPTLPRPAFRPPPSEPRRSPSNQTRLRAPLHVL